MTGDDLIVALLKYSAEGHGDCPVVGPPSEFGTREIMGVQFDPNGYLEGSGTHEVIQLTDALNAGRPEETRHT